MAKGTSRMRASVHLNALVVVVDSDRELLLRRILTNDVLVQILFQLQRLGQLVRSRVGLLIPVIFQNGVAYGDAFVADVGTRIVAERR
jgi:hypothetical protein